MDKFQPINEIIVEMKCSECGSHEISQRGCEVFCRKCGMIMEDLSEE